MKLSNLLIAALVLVMASCSTTDSSNTTQENTNETADQVTNDSTLVDGNYSIAKIEPLVTWVANKVIGSGHSGIIPLKNGKFKVVDGKIAAGIITFDMNGFTVTDIEGESKDNFNSHLKSEDFLFTEQFPTAVITITGSSELDGVTVIESTLDMHGVSQSYNIPVSITPFEKDGQVMFSIKGDVAVDRTKHDITYGSGSFFDDLGDKAINDEIIIKFAFTAN
jgi:polyisoprenoid-binding protein YceI